MKLLVHAKVYCIAMHDKGVSLRTFTKHENKTDKKTKSRQNKTPKRQNSTVFDGIRTRDLPQGKRYFYAYTKRTFDCYVEVF